MRYLEIPIQVEGSLEYAKLETYLLDTPTEKIRIQKRPMVVICPGGGYEKLSYREGEPLAVHFLDQGYHACVLRYSVAPARFPTPLLELGEVMKLIRARAEEWQVDTDHILLHGASAGGHLAASLSTLYSSDETRPDFQILLYPVISMVPGITHGGSRKNLLGDNPTKELEDAYSLERRVSPRSPQAFIVLSADDGAVPPMNSIGYFLALNQQKVPVSMHIYPIGGHGWGFRDNFTYKRQWTEELEKWLRDGVKFEKK